MFGYSLVAFGAYLLGSIPTGFLVAKARGIDIRTMGSGNIGATNAFRILGTGPGVFVLFADALKGWVAVRLLSLWIVDALMRQDSSGGTHELAAVVAGLFAVLGHNYTCWLHFKGGKGIATSAGVFFALAPMAAGIAVGAWGVVFLLSRYVSLASVAASIVLPAAVWLTANSLLISIVTTALGLLAILKHRGNIRRLLDGTEQRIQFKKGEVTP
jgi:glycerol-3-phosphate acyltransferase PlsY